MDTSQTEICILSFLTTLLHQLHSAFFFFFNYTNYQLPRWGGDGEFNNTDHRPRMLLCQAGLSIKVKKRSRSPLRLQPFRTAQRHLSTAERRRQRPRGFPSQLYREFCASPGPRMVKDGAVWSKIICTALPSTSGRATPSVHQLTSHKHTRRHHFMISSMILKHH